ncbi:MAG: hypothetical protein L3J87_03385 [Thermoplasmata archaeon]|nr:hypothetical protein [Thermoplasmata archaeon]MCI4344651.1 hypothetical protein [Thermoplasmata archaeon]
MRGVTIGLVGTVGLLLLAILPAPGAATPLNGVITTCSSNWSCHFVFNGSTGKGWANGSSSGYLYPGTMSLRLPGEAKTSANLTYWTYIQRLNGTYTYWTIGNFFGTDVNTGKVVYGTTDSNYTITCHGHSGHGGGCTYTYTVDNGTIVVRFTKAEQTSTTISCTPTSIDVAGKTTCKATVKDLWNGTHYPTGKLHLTSSGGGSFSNKGTCTLGSTGNCTFTWHPSDNSCGSSTLAATYGGTTYFYKSSGSTLEGITGGC